MRNRPSLANTSSVPSLCLARSTGADAAVSLPANSVGSRQLKAGTAALGRLGGRAAAVAVAVLLMFPVIAAAKIVVNRGMFGISLGETRAQVQAKLGPPVVTFRKGRRVLWLYPGRQLDVMFSGKRMLLHFLDTKSRTQRTARGVGVGSREQDVTRLVPGAQCGTTPGVPGTDCFVFTTSKGKTIGTDFTIGSHGRVTDVSIDWLR